MFFLHTTKIFKMVCLCEYLESGGLPHHSSDVFLHEGSIFECFGTVCEFLGLIWMPQCHQMSKGSPRNYCKVNENQRKSTKIKENQRNSIKFNEKYSNFRKYSVIWWACDDFNTFKSMRKMLKQSYIDRNWVPHEKIHRSCGAEVLPTPNTCRDRSFENL